MYRMLQKYDNGWELSVDTQRSIDLLQLYDTTLERMITGIKASW